MTLFDLIHFTRPYWLVLIAAIVLLTLFVNKNPLVNNRINKLIDPNLRQHLVYKDATRHLNKWLGLAVAISLCLGLAGISWTKAPSTQFENTRKTVMVVDQSLSMYSTDIKPNRQTQLKQSVRDILTQSKEGDIALVAFAGEGFVISPFSQDRDTITHFLLALEPIIMPVYGSDLSSGIETALSLSNDDTSPLHLIVFTDDLSEQDKVQIPALLNNRNTQLDLIAVGTETPAIITLPDGQILRQNGRNILPVTPLQELANLTESLGGRFYQGRLSPDDVSRITDVSLDNQSIQQAQNKSIQWIEQGHWFALPFVIWLAFQFRKGMLLMMMLTLFTLPSEKVQASPLDWFKTKDQKGQQAVDQGDWQTADQYFQQPNWKAASSYALENYPTTAEALQSIERSAADNYNLGNALALLGNVQEAISAYEKALEQDPSLSVAQENLDYLKQYQEKQREEKQNNASQQENNAEQSEQNSQDQTDNPENSSDNTDQNDAKEHTDAKNDNKKNEKQDNTKTPEDNGESPDANEQPSTELENTQLNNEEAQALNQWLRQIQDDPGLLLQRKLWHLHQEKRSDNRYTQKDGQNPW